MKKTLARLATIIVALALLLPAQAAHAAPGQEKAPRNLVWSKSTVCVENWLDKTWDTYVKKAATDWQSGSAFRIVTKNRAQCGSAYQGRTVTIKSGSLETGTLATTNNTVKGDYPNTVISGSRIVVDVEEFWKNNPRTRQPIICHELGHAFGVAHYEDRSSCMNVTTYDGVATKPHARDLAILKARYGKG
ncbi:matrixin family metalloprotease [Microbacterium marinilacus]|nr:matrixin family metalloprotease [Microbacterium marinilacus]MBY0688635.1 hypothetical protein [Microbacterium marinilacus]